MAGSMHREELNSDGTEVAVGDITNLQVVALAKEPSRQWISLAPICQNIYS